MKRREALRNIGLTTGFVVATPSIFSLLQSCKTDVATWTPSFLTQEEGIMVKNIVDVILPKTEIPSASELNVPEFIDKYMNEVLMDDAQELTKSAFANVLSLVKTEYNEDINKVSKEQYENLLDTQMLTKKESKAVYKPESETKEISNSDLLNSLKSMTITAYLTTEEIGENVLAYDPIPAAYYCGDLNELTGGKSWSLR